MTEEQRAELPTNDPTNPAHRLARDLGLGCFPNEEIADDIYSVLATIARLEAEAKRLKDATWSDMSDAELGRCFKAFARQVEETSQKSWSGDAEMRLGLMNMGLQQAIKMAAESNAETFTYTAEGFHSESRALGDWTITIARLSSRAKDQSQ